MDSYLWLRLFINKLRPLFAISSRIRGCWNVNTSSTWFHRRSLTPSTPYMSCKIIFNSNSYEIRENMVCTCNEWMPQYGSKPKRYRIVMTSMLAVQHEWAKNRHKSKYAMSGYYAEWIDRCLNELSDFINGNVQRRMCWNIQEVFLHNIQVK